MGRHTPALSLQSSAIATNGLKAQWPPCCIAGSWQHHSLGRLAERDNHFDLCRALTPLLLPQGRAFLRCRAWQQLRSLGSSARGRERVQREMRLCDDNPLQGEGDVQALADWAQSAYDFLVGLLVALMDQQH